MKAPQYGKSTVGPNTEKINKIKFYCLILCTTEPATETSWCWCWCCSCCCGRAGSILRVGGIERDQVHVVDACVQTRPLECHHYRMAHCRSGHGEASVTQSNSHSHTSSSPRPVHIFRDSAITIQLLAHCVNLPGPGARLLRLMDQNPIYISDA